MASQAGAHNTLKLAPSAALFPQHNNDTATPGLPVKAAIKIYAGCMVAYDPALSQCQFADPAMPATARVIGISNETFDNSLGAKGDLKARPEAGVWRVKSDGNLTAAHLYKPCRVIDDHTVGLPAGTDADRFAGLLVGLEGGTGFAWVLILPESAQRAPVTVTLTSTNGTMAAAADEAAVKVEGEKIGDDVRAIHAALVLHGLIATAA